MSRDRTAASGVLKALSHPTRLAILETLRDGERCVCEIWPLLDVEQPTLSKHLSVLRRRGLVASRRDGQKIIYRLSGSRVTEVIDAVLGLVRQAREERAAR